MPHTDSTYSFPAASRNFPRRWLMWVFRELSVQSGVSRLMRSSSTDLASTCPGFCIRSFNMAYSVRVRLISRPPAVTRWEAVYNVRSPSAYRPVSGCLRRSRSRAATRASSSPVSKGLVR